MYTVWKVSQYGSFSGPNTEKYGPEKASYLDIFHTVVREIQGFFWTSYECLNYFICPGSYQVQLLVKITRNVSVYIAKG